MAANGNESRHREADTSKHAQPEINSATLFQLQSPFRVSFAVFVLDKPSAQRPNGGAHQRHRLQSLRMRNMTGSGGVRCSAMLDR